MFGSKRSQLIEEANRLLYEDKDFYQAAGIFSQYSKKRLDRLEGYFEKTGSEEKSCEMYEEYLKSAYIEKIRRKKGVLFTAAALSLIIINAYQGSHRDYVKKDITYKQAVAEPDLGKYEGGWPNVNGAFAGGIRGLISVSLGYGSVVLSNRWKRRKKRKDSGE